MESPIVACWNSCFHSAVYGRLAPFFHKRLLQVLTVQSLKRSKCASSGSAWFKQQIEDNEVRSWQVEGMHVSTSWSAILVFDFQIGYGMVWLNFLPPQNWWELDRIGWFKFKVSKDSKDDQLVGPNSYSLLEAAGPRFCSLFGSLLEAVAA